MQRTFRPRVYYRNIGIIGLLFFGGMMVACLSGSILDADRALFYLVMAGFWACWLLLAFYMLIAYYREWLAVDGRQVRQRTVFVQRELLLDDSAHINWRTWPQGGSIVLRSPLARIPIDFDNFENEERVAIISHLRDSVSPDKQSGWDMFCQQRALPLLEEHPSTTEVELQPETSDKFEVLTRRKVDRLFAWMLLPSIAMTGLLVWLDGWKWWPSVFTVLPIWLSFRFLIPKAGHRTVKALAMPGGKPLMFALVALLLGVPCSAFLKAKGINPFWMWAVVFCIAVAGFAIAVKAGIKEEVKRKQEQLAGAEMADERWRALRAQSSAT